MKDADMNAEMERMIEQTVADWDDETVVWALKKLKLCRQNFPSLHEARSFLVLRKRAHCLAYRLKRFLDEGIYSLRTEDAEILSLLKSDELFTSPEFAMPEGEK